MTLLIFSVVFALVISHLCSLLEAALLSLTPSQLATIDRRNPKTGFLCRQMKQNIDRSIAVILIVNTAAHTIGAAVAGAEFGRLYGNHWLWVFTLAFTLVMVQYTEILPKTIGVRFNTSIMARAARPLNFMTMFFAPLIAMVGLLNRPFEFRRKGKEPSTADEISALAAVARNRQQISSRQERIIRAVPQLSATTARQVMLPIDNVSFISTDQSLSDAISKVGVDFHTRYPVCRGNDRNDVLGYVNFKELVAVYRAAPETARLGDLVRPIGFSEPDECVAELLERFATQRCHMAIVRGADQKSLGLVTMEDIVEELMGDLDDEFDPLPRTFYSPSEHLWVVGGGISLAQLGRETNLELPRRAEPVSKWFIRMLGRVPRGGDSYRVGNAEFCVRKLRRGSVLEFNVRKIDPAGGGKYEKKITTD
ncbi:MAG: CNNM domain-containing protein [Victivallaceae bacterium]|nr:CNNM domain-containing protein [Victivallaceae bacterium]